MSFGSILSGYPKILNVEVFTSNTITVRQANKTNNFWDLCMDIYHTFF